VIQNRTENAEIVRTYLNINEIELTNKMVCDVNIHRIGIIFRGKYY